MIYEDVELYNVAEFTGTAENGSKGMTRIPDSLRVTLNESARNAALSAAGCEIRFNLKSDSAIITLQADPASSVEVYQGAFKTSSQVLNTELTEIPISLHANIEALAAITKQNNLSFDPYLIRIVLPYNAFVKVGRLDGSFSPPETGQTPATKYLAYGSSITKGSAAVRPTGTYAMLTAQTLGVDLINLGFGGGAHCESRMADYIASRHDWDFATLELGINMFYAIDTEEFEKRVSCFIQTIARAHPDQWIFCMDLFTFRADFDPGSAKQNEFRNIVKQTVENLNMKKLVHVDGRQMLKSPTGLTADLVHPSSRGMEEIARNLSSVIRKRIGSIP